MSVFFFNNNHLLVTSGQRANKNTTEPNGRHLHKLDLINAKVKFLEHQSKHLVSE